MISTAFLLWFGSVLVVSWSDQKLHEAKVFLDGRYYSLSEAQKLVPNVGDTDGGQLTVQELQAYDLAIAQRDAAIRQARLREAERPARIFAVFRFAIIPPLILLIFGALIGWAISGFRSNS